MTRPNHCRVLLVVALLRCCFGSVGSAYASDDDNAEQKPPAEASLSGDVSGRLRPNMSQQANDAPYVILDRWGEIQYRVRPPAGMNMDRYINRQIRVSGTRIESLGNAPPILEARKIGRPVGNQRRPQMPERSPADPFDRATRQVAYEELSLPPVAKDNSIMGSPPSQGEQHSGLQPHDHDFVEGDDWDSADQGPLCGGCNQPFCSACCCFPPGRFWVRAEYLYWWTEGMRLPPLVTSGPSIDQPGYLGSSGTLILFGNNLYNGFGRSGVRLTSGVWLNSCQTIGLEGDYYALQTASTNYSAQSGGNPILSRPFFDLSPTQADPSQIVGQNIENVAAPNTIAGTVSVNAQTRFQSAGLRLLFNLCCSQACSVDECLPSLSGPCGRRVDLLIGYRYARLSDSVAINENLTSLETANPGSFLVNDGFNTQNVFNGVELGTSMLAYRGRWSATLLTKLALGNTRQSVDINGSTVTTQNGTSTTDVGGLLAQSTNIGHYARNQFAVMPELGANLGYQLTPRLGLRVGYTFVYWSSVVHAGDQIDLNVNSRLLPNDTRPLAGDTRHPQFLFNENDFWAQGISAGLDYRW
jgi:hypothetical protein